MRKKIIILSLMLVTLIFSFHATWAYFKDSKEYKTAFSGQVAYNNGLSYTIEEGDNANRALSMDFTDGATSKEYTLVIKNNSSYHLNVDSLVLKVGKIEGDYYQFTWEKKSGDETSKELKYSLIISKTNNKIPSTAEKFMVGLSEVSLTTLGGKRLISAELYNFYITPKYDIAPSSSGTFRVGSYIDHCAPAYSYDYYVGCERHYAKQLTGLVTPDGFVWVNKDWSGTHFSLNTEASYDKPEAYDWYVQSPENRPVNMLWLEKGWLTYRIPKVKGKTVDKLEIEMEIASEVEGHRDTYDSPITFGLGSSKSNIQDIARWTSHGDYGDTRRGAKNPDWLPRGINQYGYKIKLIITKWSTKVQVMSKLDGQWKSEWYWVSERNESFRADADRSIGYSSLTNDSDYYYFRIQTENETGFTLYGSGFGDYGEDMKYTITYK